MFYQVVIMPTNSSVLCLKHNIDVIMGFPFGSTFEKNVFLQLRNSIFLVYLQNYAKIFLDDEREF